MERVEVESYAQDVNAWVVRTPGRKFPALVVQGDSFNGVFGLAQSILDRARSCSCPDKELVGEAEELRDQLWARLTHYEDVLRASGFALPYSRKEWPR